MAGLKRPRAPGYLPSWVTVQRPGPRGARGASTAQQGPGCDKAQAELPGICSLPQLSLDRRPTVLAGLGMTRERDAIRGWRHPGGPPLPTLANSGQRWLLLAPEGWGLHLPLPACLQGQGHLRDPTGSLAGSAVGGWSSRHRPFQAWLRGGTPSKRIPHSYATGVGEDGLRGQPKQAPPGSRV